MKNISPLASALISVLSFAALSNSKAAVVFQQDFSSSSSILDYVGNGTNQFAFSENLSSPSSNFTITSGSLVATRNNALGSDYASIRAELPAGNLTAAITSGFMLTMDVSVFGYTTSSTVLNLSAGYVNFGNLQGATASFNTRPTSSTDFYVTGNSNSWNTASPTTVTWVVNNTGSDYLYTAPDASNRTLATGNYDLWIGSNTSGSLLNQSFSVNSNGFNAFQLQVPGWSAADAALAIDNVVVATIPEPTAGLLLGLGGLVLVVHRHRKVRA